MAKGSLEFGNAFGEAGPVRPKRAEWPIPPSFLALVHFELGRGKEWRDIEEGSRLDLDKRVFLDDLEEAGGKAYLDRTFASKVAEIIRLNQTRRN